MLQLPPLPKAIKHIAHFLKVADEHDERNMVVSYWSRMWACQVALKSVEGPKPPEVTAVVISIMDWLERMKKEHADVDGIINDTVAHAMIEEYALQLFTYADAQDQAASYGKNVIKAFYTCGILMDVLTQFGQLNEDLFAKRRYAKWKAAYIHNCLKIGEKPTPGPPKERILNSDEEDDEDDDDDYNYHKAISHNIGPNNNRTISNVPSEPSNVIPPSEPAVPPPLVPLPPPPVEPTPVPQPRIPQPVPPKVSPSSSSSSNFVGPEQIKQAQKCCKYAGSALDYDDVKTAIENLQKALSLLQTTEGN